MRQVKVFISYAREDIEVAERLYSDLKNAGVEPWIDEKDLLPGQNWELTVTNTIKESSFFLALLSENSVSKRGFVQQELKIALTFLDRSSPTDIFIIPVRLNKCEPVDERLQALHRVDLFPSYKDGFEKILRVLAPRRKPTEQITTYNAVISDVNKTFDEYRKKSGCNAETIAEIEAKRKNALAEVERNFAIARENLISDFAEKYNIDLTKLKTPKITKLRSEPKTLSDDDVENLIEKYNFYDRNLNKLGKFKNNFKDNGNGTVTDRVTHLIWQKSGANLIMHGNTQIYIDDLNSKKFAGCNDWRLPTLEELASLLESKNVNGLYIDPLFDRKQWICLTADKYASGDTWGVYFLNGYMGLDNFKGISYIRAVRTLTD
ncbi:MAG: TIR domain-containing protein [Desulfobacterales bacterium]|nr:TIR domain-containing protein [Desulfobacterales bacterium]